MQEIACRIHLNLKEQNPQTDGDCLGPDDEILLGRFPEDKFHKDNLDNFLAGSWVEDN